MTILPPSEHSDNLAALNLEAEAVEVFLRAHPDFLLTRDALLSEISLPQSSAGTLSLATRQAHILREKIRASEHVLHELHLHAHENEQRAQKLHRIALALILHPDLETLRTALMDAFDLAGCLLQIAPSSEPSSHRSTDNDDELQPAWKALLSYSSPVIPRMNKELRELLRRHRLPETGTLAVIPFGTDEPYERRGVLVLVKNEPHGFSADMGSLFLAQISELASAALARHASALHAHA